MATDEKYSVSPGLLGGILTDLGVRSIGELMEKMKENENEGFAHENHRPLGENQLAQGDYERRTKT